MSWQILWVLAPALLFAWALSRPPAPPGPVSGWGFPDEAGRRHPVPPGEDTAE